MPEASARRYRLADRPGTVAYVTRSGGSRVRVRALTAEASTAVGVSEPVSAAAGVASLAVRDLLRGPRRHGKILAVLPHVTYLEFADVVPEPRVIAISPPDAIRLPH